MLVSVVVPNLNKAPFLEETLHSLFAQEYDELEIIAIDGGSTDGSQAIFERYRDRFAHYISEPDRGQADAINKGFSLARGELIAWLNSDDIYFPWTVQRAVERFKAVPDLSLLYGDCIFIDGESRFLRYFIEVEPYNEYRLRNCGDYIMQPTTFFRRTAWESVGGIDSSLHFAFDYDFWCKLARTGGMVEYFPEVLAANRVYDKTKTSEGGNARMREIKEVYSRHRTGWWSHGYWSFWCTELMNRRARVSGVFQRFGYLFLGLGAKVLGCKNWFYSLRHPQLAQGFVGVNGDCKSHARLYLPVKPRDKALRLQVTATTSFFKPEIHLSLNSVTAFSTNLSIVKQPEEIIEIPLLDMADACTVVTLSIFFKSEGEQESPNEMIVGCIQVLHPFMEG